MNNRNKWLNYELEKEKISNLYLTPEEYERKMRELIDKLDL